MRKDGLAVNRISTLSGISTFTNTVLLSNAIHEARSARRGVIATPEQMQSASTCLEERGPVLACPLDSVPLPTPHNAASDSIDAKRWVCCAARQQFPLSYRLAIVRDSSSPVLEQVADHCTVKEN